MTEVELKTALSEDELAGLGQGSIAYLRQIDSDELRGRFPGMPDIESGLKLWAVFAADGRPIMLTDARSSALAGAIQNDLTPVSIH